MTLLNLFLDKKPRCLLKSILNHQRMRSGYPQRLCFNPFMIEARTSRFRSLNIHSKDIFFPLMSIPKGNVNRTFYDASFAADMIVDRIHKYYSIHFFQDRCSCHSFYNPGGILSCDPADCAVKYQYRIIHACGFNVSGGHSFGIHGKYFFFHVLSYSILIFLISCSSVITVTIRQDHIISLHNWCAWFCWNDRFCCCLFLCYDNHALEYLILHQFLVKAPSNRTDIMSRMMPFTSVPSLITDIIIFR